MGNLKPLVIDLFCGLGGWTEGFLAEGYDVVGFDIERRPYPAQLVLQDVLTLDGRRFKDAAVIVASPPCQEYSYMAMPWSRAKEKATYIRARQTEWARLTALFWACFRIARQAGVPLVVENVKGAQPWVGRAKANFGSFYLWGDIESVGGAIVAPRPKFGETLRPKRGGKRNPDGTEHGQGSWFAVADSKNQGIKQHGSGAAWFDEALNERRRATTGPLVEGYKGVDGKSWIRDKMKDPRPSHGTNSPARKAASAQIAKIPFPLAQHIARVFKPAA